MIPAADRPPAESSTAEVRRTSVREVLQSGTDPDEALEFYRGVYDGHDMAFAPSSSSFGFRYRATGDGRLSLRTSSVSAARSGFLAPERQYLLAWSVEGGIVVDDDVLLRAGVPVMYPAGRPFHVSAPAGTKHLVHFDADFLEAVAVVGTDAAPVPLAFPVTVSAERLAPLQAVLREVARPLLDVAVVDADRAALDLRLAEAVLGAFRSDADRRGTAAPAGTVERAKAFMYAHFDRTIAATDIAAAAEVSVRTLQEGFQRREGSTPMAYLRDLRLEKARLGLQLADPRETSVATVAHSCGFRHMGRFSGSYFSMYGEYPGDTLRGRRRLIAAADIVG
ncbi:helix-turn-helix domain-containing protein [Curtobacterium sp. C2H10]|uniref:helix-turn-helix domain-containing protein n=1 Tax=Curtobacterium sp. C2H10 TaxID=2736664 RepID=UPI0021C1FDF7|nr:helix-turn-helix domain-containing protein [Curtobacterium sp. C2H10]MCT9622871.1 AraC family transcriptional regulator [Curtobacterium sp. C2H10]